MKVFFVGVVGKLERDVPDIKSWSANRNSKVSELDSSSRVVRQLQDFSGGQWPPENLLAVLKDEAVGLSRQPGS